MLYGITVIAIGLQICIWKAVYYMAICSRQMIQRLFILLIISFLAFVSLNAMSDPIDIIKSMDPHITQQQIDIYKRQQGLDNPQMIRYGYWFRNALKGDFGISRLQRKRFSLSHG